MQVKMTAGAAIKNLVGSGDQIMLLTLPFLVAGVVLNVLFPAFFGAGGPSTAAIVIAAVLLVPGVILWLWSVVLILTRVPKRELITYGPYALVKHPLYTSVALLVLPGVGLLLNTWVGVVVGVVLYFAARRYAPQEEQSLAAAFRDQWDAYCKKVLIPWL